MDLQQKGNLFDLAKQTGQLELFFEEKQIHFI